MGSKGIYQQTNVEKRRPYTLSQWHTLCQDDDHKPPNLTTDRASRPIPISRKRKHSPSHSHHTNVTSDSNAKEAPPPPPPSANVSQCANQRNGLGADISCLYITD